MQTRRSPMLLHGCRALVRAPFVMRVTSVMSLAITDMTYWPDSYVYRVCLQPRLHGRQGARKHLLLWACDHDATLLFAGGIIPLAP